MLLVGEAGVGKSRLAAEFAEEVHAGGGTVLYGRADEEALLPAPAVRRGAAPPHHPRRQRARRGALEPDREILSRLLPDLAAGAPARAPPPSTAPTTRCATGSSRRSRRCCARRRRGPRVLLDPRRPALGRQADAAAAAPPAAPSRSSTTAARRSARSATARSDREHALVDLLTDLRRERRYDRLTLPGPRRRRDARARRRPARTRRHGGLRPAPARADRGQRVLHRGDDPRARRAAGSPTGRGR